MEAGKTTINDAVFVEIAKEAMKKAHVQGCGLLC